MAVGKVCRAGKMEGIVQTGHLRYERRLCSREHTFAPDKRKKLNSMVPVIASFTAVPHRIFLLDGLGALLSAACLGVILARFPDIFGVPSDILYPLAVVACVFAGYSLACYFLAPVRWWPYLAGIATANTVYSLLTIWLVFGADFGLLLLGRTYFVLELIVLAGLIYLELSIVVRGLPKK